MAKLDFNTSPYYDDFETVKGDNYRRILFRPSFAVQARELTQLQTNLQEQLKDIINATLDSGNQLVPGELIVLTDVQQIILTSNGLFDTYHTDSTDPLVARYVIGMNIQTNDGEKVGKIITSRPPSTGEDYESIYVIPKTGSRFVNTDTLYESGNDTGETLAVVGDGTKSAVLAYIGAGTYYINGFAVEVAPQIIIINDGYTDLSSLNYQIGLTVTESIVNELTDASLLDPTLGDLNANVSAAGAERYKLAVTLSSKKFDEDTGSATLNEGFVELARIIDGKIQNKISYQDSIATKDYVTDVVSQEEEPFTIDVEDDIDNSVKLKITSGSKIVDGKKVVVRQANEFTLSGSTGTDKTSSLLDGTTSLWGGSSVHTESGLRVVTKNGINIAGGGVWPDFAPDGNTVENNRVVLTKKIGSTYKSIGSARIENITLAENITKIHLDGGDIAEYTDLTPGEFLVQTYNTTAGSGTSGFKAKFLSAVVGNTGNIVLNVQVHFGIINTGANLERESGSIAVPASLISAVGSVVAVGSDGIAVFNNDDYSWLPAQAEFEIGLNDIQFDEIEIAKLTINDRAGTHGAEAGDKIELEIAAAGTVSALATTVEGTVVSQTTTEIVVKDMTGKFIPIKGKYLLDGDANATVDVTAVTYEPPINPYTIADVTHLVKYTATDSKRGLTDVICELDTSRLYSVTVSSDEIYPISSEADRVKTRELGEFSNPRLYKIGTSVKDVDGVTITKIRKTFQQPANNDASGGWISINLTDDFTFDPVEPVLVWSSNTSAGLGGF